MADNKIDYNALAQAVDNTWGRSSTPKTASYSVKVTLQGPDVILISYAVFCLKKKKRAMINLKRRYQDEATAVVASVIKNLKSRYKDLAGSSLATKEISSSNSLEIVDFNCHTARRTAYFRLKVLLEVS